MQTEKAEISLQENQAPTEVIKLFPCSTQLSTKFILLTNVKMQTTVDILTFIRRINTRSERFKARKFFICLYFFISSWISCSVKLSMKKGL